MPKSEDPLIGATLGNYFLEQSSGAGGFGRVYRAHHVNLSPTRKFAVKVLNTELCRQPDFAARFMREARATSEVRSPHIVEVYNYDQTTAGTLYYAMEYLVGEPLSATIKREGPFDWPRTRHIALQICSALRVAHRKHIIHRDLKPDNCFRLTEGDDNDFIKIIDFGLARDVARQLDSLKTTKYAMGTPGYMPPEQTNNKGIDTYSDVWALAAIMFEMLTGDLPIKLRETYEQYILDVNFSAPRRLFTVAPACGAPREVEALLAKALHTDPMERFFTMAALSRAIERVDRAPKARSGSTAASIRTAASLSAVELPAPSSPPAQADPFGDTLAPSGARLHELVAPHEDNGVAITRARKRQDDESTLLRAPPPLGPSPAARASSTRSAAQPSQPKKPENPAQRASGAADSASPTHPSVGQELSEPSGIGNTGPQRSSSEVLERSPSVDSSTDIWPSLPALRSAPASSSVPLQRRGQGSDIALSTSNKATLGSPAAITPEHASHVAATSQRSTPARVAALAVLALAVATLVLIYRAWSDNVVSDLRTDPTSSSSSHHMSEFASNLIEFIDHSGRVLLLAAKSSQATNHATTDHAPAATTEQIDDIIRARVGDSGLTECNFLSPLTIKVLVRDGGFVLQDEELHRFWEASSIDCLRAKVNGAAPEGSLDSGPYEVEFSG